MIHFFGDEKAMVFAVQAQGEFTSEDIAKLNWLFGNAQKIEKSVLTDFFVGPRAAMITPWSTNAVEITQNMCIPGIIRIEEFRHCREDEAFDPMLFQRYNRLGQDVFTIDIQPEPIREIGDIAAFNASEGLALSDDEVEYLENLSAKLSRPLTDSEVFGFSQINSEHCRHKIFNGTFVIDGNEMPQSLFRMIKQTSAAHPNSIVSAYKDNVAFTKGPEVVQFAPASADKPDIYVEKTFESVISLKAETHNFPTTVEPFNGAATGSGGEIRDRLAGGQGSLPLAGTAVYMTSYPRVADRPWERSMAQRNWLDQTPLDILIKASNGASDFGNKFGQPLISGSVLTFEHAEDGRMLGYDKVIMQAGGIGYGKLSQAVKKQPAKGDRIVVLGGENYRIGMGGAAVSSADTGEMSSGIELNAIQRSNPEMQKRAANAVRGLVESDNNPIVSIHDHGAGGHLNCLSELVEATGGHIDLDKLPVGDPTLSAMEIIGNESQERMGLVIRGNDLETLERIASRERAPLYDVGEVSDDHRFRFESSASGQKPMDLDLGDMFGSSPKTVMADTRISREYETPHYEASKIREYLENVLRLESVACKDWLTNKVDRCVGGRVAKQQCAGPIQLPLNNVGVMALDFKGKHGIATSIGHSPMTALVDPAAGSRNAIAEALTNIVFAPLSEGLKSVSLSANWMWPCKNQGEDARLYDAVKACSDFAIALGINIPTGKDSLSMKQKYPDGEVISPGTVIISAAGHCDDITRVVEPVAKIGGGGLYLVDFSGHAPALGGSAFMQTLNAVGSNIPDIVDPTYFAQAFDAVQQIIREGRVTAGHDVGSGGLVTTILEMLFADNGLGADIDLSSHGSDAVAALFAENAAVVMQMQDEAAQQLIINGIRVAKIGTLNDLAELNLTLGDNKFALAVPAMRDTWYSTSYLLDQKQSGEQKARERFENYKKQPLRFTFPSHFDGQMPTAGIARPKAAILREKGSNSEREMAHAMHLAGFEVRDVHMTDLISGRETLEDISFLGAVGGFSNSDVLGSAKGWAGAFLYNERARTALENFFSRPDTLSVGICNGCQLFIELGLINPDHDRKPRMLHNQSGKHESGFTSVRIGENSSVMLSSLAGTTLGVWISHGEGRFDLPYDESRYDIVAKYAYEGYPANPNGSHFDVAMMADRTGRHLVMMPHIERSIFPWNWAYYPDGRTDKISPWIEAFVNAQKWVEVKHPVSPIPS